MGWLYQDGRRPVGLGGLKGLGGLPDQGVGPPRELPSESSWSRASRPASSSTASPSTPALVHLLPATSLATPELVVLLTEPLTLPPAASIRTGRRYD